MRYFFCLCMAFFSLSIYAAECPCYYKPKPDKKFIISFKNKFEKNGTSKYYLSIYDNNKNLIKTYETNYFDGKHELPKIKNVFYDDINFDGYLDIGITLEAPSENNTIYYVYDNKKEEVSFVGYYKIFNIDIASKKLWTVDKENNQINYYWRKGQIFAMQQ